MKYCTLTAVALLLGATLVGLGCARAARDTSGFALREQTVINAPFEETWHAVKQVLREQGYEIYTRDKRGAFVAYTPMKRMLWLQPRRTKFTIELARVTPEETAISIESIRQVYGVTLLTHPNWHDRKQSDPALSQAILDSIREATSGEGVVVESFLDDNGQLESESQEESSSQGDSETPPVIEETPLPAQGEPVVEEAENI